MKKLISILVLSTVLISCSKEVEPIQELPNCDCNEVVEISSDTINVQSNTLTAGKYWTINQCTGVQNEYNWSSFGYVPSIGDCK